MNAATVLYQIGPELQLLLDKYVSTPEIVRRLEAMRKDILEHVELFQASADRESQSSAASADSLKLRYQVNLLVDNSKQSGAPVIVETHPVYNNLFGRIEHEMFMGAARTDFTKIRSGAFHRANGGYLIMSARDLLSSPYAWEGVKRVLRDGNLRIIEIGSQLGLISTETLEPEPIPLSIKVILIGPPLIYYLLSEYDEDFPKMFKVQAEFSAVMERTPEAEHDYGLFVNSVVSDNQLPPFDGSAVARIVEYGSRLVEDQGKLSTRFGRIADLVREAAYWARKNGDLAENQRITAKSVDRAIEEAIYRGNLLDERIQEMIAQEVILVSLSGAEIGRTNALSVMSLGDFAFGRPTRLSAAVAPGRTGVLDIERQAKLGGPIHTKGVLILSGYLHNTYGHLAPFNLSATLTFEQSYSEIDGDSASAAELYALLSAIAHLPLRQDLSVTGSINQHGQIQPIGGVNEKIEGFFAACRAKGLSGSQGVLIPRANMRHLMLRQEVIQAVADGQFHIYPLENVNQGLELLSGLPAGEPDSQGNYPEGSFNHALAGRLASFKKAVKPDNQAKEET